FRRIGDSSPAYLPYIGAAVAGGPTPGPLCRGAGDADHFGRLLREGLLPPTRAVVVSAEDLASARAEVNLLGSLGAEGHADGRAAGGDAAVDALPAVAEVRAAHEPALIAAEVAGDAGVERVGVHWRGPHAARVDDRAEALEVQVVPVRAAVDTPPDADPVGDEDGARGG